MKKLMKICRGYQSHLAQPPKMIQLHQYQLQEVDSRIDQYGNLTRAYLRKRFMKKSEVWPKIRLLAPVRALQKQYSFQTISQLRNSLPQNLLQEMRQKLKITPQYMISVFLQADMQAVLQQLTKKMLFCGAVPRLQDKDKYDQLRSQCQRLYRISVFGQQLSPFESTVVKYYLNQKQRKYINFIQHKNQFLSCKWTKIDQLFLQDRKTFPRDPRFFDDFKVLFKKVDFKQMAQHQSLCLKLDQKGLFKRLYFQYIDKRNYHIESKQSVTWASSIIFNRIGHWCRSQQFVNQINVPPDFFIELAVLELHIWIVYNQIGLSKNSKAKFLQNLLLEKLQFYTKQKIGMLSIRKKNQFTGIVNKNKVTLFQLLHLHFCHDEATCAQPNLGLDSLVWTFIYHQKVDLYSPQVYKMAQYILNNYKHFMRYSFVNILQADFQFDVFRISPLHQAKFKKINPPLSQAEVLAQASSPQQIKRYHYLYKKEIKKIYSNKMLENHRNELARKIQKFQKKFKDMDTYDYFNQVEDKVKEAESLRSPWKQQQNDLSESNKLKMQIKKDNIGLK